MKNILLVARVYISSKVVCLLCTMLGLILQHQTKPRWSLMGWPLSGHSWGRSIEPEDTLTQNFRNWNVEWSFKISRNNHKRYKCGAWASWLKSLLKWLIDSNSNHRSWKLRKYQAIQTKRNLKVTQGEHIPCSQAVWEAKKTMLKGVEGEGQGQEHTKTTRTIEPCKHESGVAEYLVFKATIICQIIKKTKCLYLMKLSCKNKHK